jgi:pimeloyl-ACP methyl ester carboxylesterase
VAALDALRIHLRQRKVWQRKVWLMGHSEGGEQVLHYACCHAERVSGLILIDTAAVWDDAQKRDPNNGPSRSHVT